MRVDPHDTWIVITGNPVDGFVYVGPFVDEERAIQELEYCSDSAWVAKLSPVEEFE